jgi:hypothetical protein
MPSLNLTNKQLRYTAADLTAIDRALALLLAMADFDPQAKQDATTAMTALTHLRKLVADSRGPK